MVERDYEWEKKIADARAARIAKGTRGVDKIKKAILPMAPTTKTLQKKPTKSGTPVAMKKNTKTRRV